MIWQVRGKLQVHASLCYVQEKQECTNQPHPISALLLCGAACSSFGKHQSMQHPPDIHAAKLD